MCLLHFLRLIRLGAPKDLSQKSGNVTKGVIYSNTVAMLPNKKESAYMHIPTFTSGVIFHLGTFLAFFCFLFLIIKPVWKLFFDYTLISAIIAICLWISFFFGVGLFIKRLVSKQLRPISNMDDFISVCLTALFQKFSALLFTIFAFYDFFLQYFSFEIHKVIICAYYLVSALLFLYLPFSKLKHFVYYFAARYHLGFFYGRRGTWPSKEIKK